MTGFFDREALGSGVEAVECFLFKQGATRFAYTSADRVITLPAYGDFQPATISCGDLTQSNEDGAGGIEVSVERTNPVALLFQSGTPPLPVRLIVLQAHEDHLDDPAPWWTGRIVTAKPKGPAATLSGVSVIQLLQKAATGAAMSKLCNRVLYSPGCGVAQWVYTDAAVLSGVAGRVITSATFAARPDGWYEAGKLYTPSGVPCYIVKHVGANLTLLHAVAELVAGSHVQATAGCDHRYETCVTKFHNGDNSLALKWAASKNPFIERVF